MGRPVIDLTDRTFGALTVLRQVPKPDWDKGHCVKWWQCRCVCGSERIYRGNQLKKNAKSCGCLQEPARLAATTTHGLSKSREYGIWASMVQRCTNPNNFLYDRYGARGLVVADRWRVFVNFYEDMGPAPPKHSIDRIDNSVGYTPGNCRWADHFQQNRNRSQSHWIEWNGERLTVAEWSRKLHVTRNTVKDRWRTHQSLSPIKPQYWPRKSPANTTA